MNLNFARKMRTVLLVIACIMCVVGVVLSNNHSKQLAHKPENIKIEIVSSESKYDDRYYYVYTDFKIDNNTGATIDYIAVTTYFTDKNGKSIGTMTSNFGSSYSDTALNLKEGDSVTKETYLSEWRSSSSYSKLFAELYNNGIDNLIITYEITRVKWSDNYDYSR